ncbi:MAG: hypothetical protein ACRD19_15015 [Terriglobia bacterium]
MKPHIRYCARGAFVVSWPGYEHEFRYASLKDAMATIRAVWRDLLQMLDQLLDRY